MNRTQTIKEEKMNYARYIYDINKTGYYYVENTLFIFVHEKSRWKNNANNKYERSL